MLDYLAAIGDAAERFDSRLDHVLVNENLVAVLFHVTGQAARPRSSTPISSCSSASTPDSIAEVWAVPRDQHAVDEFWR